MLGTKIKEKFQEKILEVLRQVLDFHVGNLILLRSSNPLLDIHSLYSKEKKKEIEKDKEMEKEFFVEHYTNL
jgi:hypothetical protein